MVFIPGIIDSSAVQFSTSQTYVGAQDASNVATFKFTPATSISEIGGMIEITTPMWYGIDSTTTLYYPFESPCECSASFIGSGLFQGPASFWNMDIRGFTKKY
jgi:hypothetical protein